MIDFNPGLPNSLLAMTGSFAGGSRAHHENSFRKRWKNIEMLAGQVFAHSVCASLRDQCDNIEFKPE